MSKTSDFQKFYKVLKKKVESSVAKRTYSSSKKGSHGKKPPKKLTQASTSQTSQEDDIFSGPITQVKLILEDSSSDSEGEYIVDLKIKCEYCLKKFATKNKLYEHKLVHLSIPVEKLILPTPAFPVIVDAFTQNTRLERTVPNQTVETRPILTLQPAINNANNLVVQQPVLTSLPQIPNLELFVQPPVQPVPQLQHNIPQLQQVLQQNVPQMQQVLHHNPHLQQVPQLQLSQPNIVTQLQNNVTQLQNLQPNAPLLQLPLEPIQQAVLLKKKKLIEVNGFSFEQWVDDNTSDDTNSEHEEEIKTVSLEQTDVEITNLQPPATVTISDNEPVDPLAIDQPTVPVEISNQTDPLATNQPNLNIPLQLGQLVAIPMQNGQILIAAPLPLSANNLNSLPQKMLMPFGNIASGTQMPINNIASGAQLPIANIVSGTQLPIGNIAIGTQLPISNVLSGAQLQIGNIASGAQLPNVAIRQPTATLPYVANNITQEQQIPELPISNIATQLQSTQLPVFNFATQESNLMLPTNAQRNLLSPIESVLNNTTEVEDIVPKDEVEKSYDLMEDELNYLVEKEQKINNEKLIKQTLLRQTKSTKRVAKKLSDILKETEFEINEDMIGAKQRRRRRPGVAPRELRKGELKKKMLAEKAATTNTSTENIETAVAEKIIANIDLTDTEDLPQKNIPTYTPPPNFTTPGPSNIAGSAILPGSWDKKPNDTISAPWNQINKIDATNIDGQEIVVRRNLTRVDISEIPVKTSFLEALLNQTYKAPAKNDPQKIYTLKTYERKKPNNEQITVEIKTVAEKKSPLINMAASKTVTQENMVEENVTQNAMPREKVTQKDIVEKTVPANTKTVTPKMIVGKNLNEYKTLCMVSKGVPIIMSSTRNEVPTRYDKLIKDSILHCMYCNQFSVNWYDLISHMNLHLKVRLSQVQNCKICTKNISTKEGSLFCHECAPFHKDAQDKYDLKFNKERENFRFVKLSNDFVEEECILEGLDTECRLLDPLKEEPIEENENVDTFEQNDFCTNIDPIEQNDFCTNIDPIEQNDSCTNIDPIEENDSCTNIDPSQDDAIPMDSEIPLEEPMCTEKDRKENEPCTNIDSFKKDAIPGCVWTFDENDTTDEAFVEQPVSTEIQQDSTNIDSLEQVNSCTNIDPKDDSCTKKETVRKSCTKINPFKEKNATLLTYCESCYYFCLKLTNCGIKNYIFKYKCVDDTKFCKQLLKCDKCKGRFTRVKNVIRYVTKKKKIIKKREPANNVFRMMKIQNNMAKLQNFL